jgi:hypothetical protein
MVDDNTLALPTKCTALYKTTKSAFHHLVIALWPRVVGLALTIQHKPQDDTIR